MADRINQSILWMVSMSFVHLMDRIMMEDHLISMASVFESWKAVARFLCVTGETPKLGNLNPIPNSNLFKCTRNRRIGFAIDNLELATICALPPGGSQNEIPGANRNES